MNATTVQQLAFPMGPPAGTGVDAVVSIARNAVGLDRRPAFAAFTNGKVTVESADDERVVLATDSPWAVSTIRTALLYAGCAVEGDPTHEATVVTVWATARREGAELPEAALTEDKDQYGRLSLLLDGPDGTVEQQVGSGGHNDLIVHARHPFPSAVRTSQCDRHGDCWMRSQPWPHAVSPRRHIHTVVTGTGYAWDVTPAAEQAMRALYLEHVHQTRPGGEQPAFRVVTPAERVREVRAES